MIGRLNHDQGQFFYSLLTIGLPMRAHSSGTPALRMPSKRRSG